MATAIDQNVKVQWYPSSPVSASFPRPETSPPLRFFTRADSNTSLARTMPEDNDEFLQARTRRFSLKSKSAKAESNPALLHIPSPHDRSRPVTADSMLYSSKPKKQRNSLLVAASDALGFKFGRRAKSVSTRQPAMPIILPDVIEISATRRDEEVEERERLRDAAALSLGINTMLSDSRDREASTDDNEAHLTELADETTTLNTEPEDISLASPKSVEQPNLSALSVGLGRNRAGSYLSHSRTNSVTPVAVPEFPSTVRLLKQAIQLSSTLPKFYPPSSLRIFALSKHWKSRFMILTTPIIMPTRAATPSVSYLHLFKSSGPEEKELERLEINEDSVVFVAEEEMVGGRKHVIKVGGLDVGVLRKELNHEESGRTMWFLQITDAHEAQKWIAAIKNAVLGQRSMRAGLGFPTTALQGSNEPRGDMDVMLSIRAQNTPNASSSNHRISNSIAETASTRAAISQPLETASISSHSVRSQAPSHHVLPRSPVPPMPSSAAGNAVSALKGLFSTRPRSPSAASIVTVDSSDLYHARHDHDRENIADESFGSMGSNLLNMLRTTPTAASPVIIHDGATSRPLATMTAPPTLPISGPPNNIRAALDRKIVVDRYPWSTASTDHHSVNQYEGSRPVSPLQPPPRKRWTTTGAAASSTFSQNNVSGASLLVTVNDDGSGTATPAGSFADPAFSFGTPELKPRNGSIKSVSSIASGENTNSRSSTTSTKRGSKRWSRQSASLPQRTSPPSGPPPAAPSSSSNSRLLVHPYAAENSRSRASSSASVNSRQSVISELPSFKRSSISSTMSITNAASLPVQTTAAVNGNFTNASFTNGHYSRVNGSSTHSQRMSMPPPPRPAPTMALPPAPENNSPNSAPPTKVSFRESMRDPAQQRAFRLSLVAPKPPPASAIPPRPDEVIAPKDFTNDLYTIPASPPMKPPPTGPLPPTPIMTTSTPTHARSSSLKQRLRILSTPSNGSNTQNHNKTSSSRRRPVTLTAISSTPMPIADIVTSTTTQSQPSTPIGERITHPSLQNDPSYLQLYTPVSPAVTIPAFIPAAAASPPLPSPTHVVDDNDDESITALRSLSPPPRKNSRHSSFSLAGKENAAVFNGTDNATPDQGEKTTDEPAIPSQQTVIAVSLSRRGSVVSLGMAI